MMLLLSLKDGSGRYMLYSENILVMSFMTWPNKRSPRREDKATCMWIMYPYAAVFHRSMQFPIWEDMSRATVPFQLQ